MKVSTALPEPETPQMLRPSAYFVDQETGERLCDGCYTLGRHTPVKEQLLCAACRQRQGLIGKTGQIKPVEGRKVAKRGKAHARAYHAN